MDGRVGDPASGAPEPSGFFAMRTPLLPVEDWVGWSAGLVAAAAVGEPERFRAAVERDVLVLRRRLEALLERPEVSEALFVASPSLCDGLALWRADPESEGGQKVERSLVKYVSRMAMRSTPFGLFAGNSVGAIGPTTELRLAAQGAHRRHTRLDGAYLEILCRALAADPALRRELVVVPSSSLYLAGGRLRYVEVRVVGLERSHRLIALEPSPYLELVLARAEGGARPDELARDLVAHDPEIALDEASAYVDELIAGQILVHELSPVVTGPEPLPELIEQLGRVPPAAAIAGRLAEVDRAITALDDAPANPPDAYRAIARMLDGFPAEVELSRLFQVDLFKPAPGATLGDEVVGEMLRGAELFRRMDASTPAAGLARFRDDFKRRYERRQVPLVEALDEEAGLGFERSGGPAGEAAPLIDGLAFPAAAADPTVTVGPRFERLVSLVGHALIRGDRELTLSPADVASLGDETQGPLPDAFAVIAQLGAASPEALAAGDFLLYLRPARGPSGANRLGRFCHGDPELSAAVAAHLRAEEAHRPDAIYAEIVHLPEGRVGNILVRPLLRSHEIPYLGRSGAPRDRQLPIGDLLLSIEDERIVLRSRRLGCEVIPRLTSAHYHPGLHLGLYRFLGALQQQRDGGDGITLGPLDALPFVPRIRHGRVVLSLARWRLGREELAALAGATRDARFTAALALRERLRLPRLVQLVDGDNHLPVDLDNVLSVDSFVQLVARRDRAELRELAPGPDEAVASGPEGRYQHELVVPFVRRVAAETAARPTPSPPAGSAVTRAKRIFPPGSEWLYAKIYSGVATADRVLREVVGPLVAEARAAGTVDRWFFIRYGDPDWHLRVRLRGAPATLLAEVVPRLHERVAPLLDDGTVGGVALDTYSRELERYGDGRGIELAERLFEIDSDAALAVVDAIDGEAGQDASWRVALVAIDRLLGDLGLDAEERLAAAERTRRAMRGEHPPSVELDRALGDRFRRERAACEVLVAPSPPVDHPLALGFEIMEERSRRNAPVIDALRAAERAGELPRPLRLLARDYAHMTVNRMLRAAARAQELVLYDFLARLYRSALVRATRTSTSSRKD